MTTQQNNDDLQTPEQRDHARRLAAFDAGIGREMVDALNRGALADQAENARAMTPTPISRPQDKD